LIINRERISTRPGGVHNDDRKKLADAAQPLYATFNDQQKQRFAETMFGGERETY
jgi:hypothetical protein